MDDKELDALLADETSPNEPLAMRGVSGASGLGGRRLKVSPAQARERRQAMSACLQAGMSKDAIISVFLDKYRMSEESINRLRNEVINLWLEEDHEAITISRGAARRRILQHINRAAKEQKWAAVAALEKVLSEVEGTIAAAPIAPVNAGGNEMELIMQRLGATDPSQLQVMIERERVIVQSGEQAIPARANIKPRAILGKRDGE